MLDKKLEVMLQAANTLTAEDLDYLRGGAPVAAAHAERSGSSNAETGPVDSVEAPERVEPEDATAVAPAIPSVQGAGPRRRSPAHASAGASSRGEYERRRTRESKVSTECIGHERQKHDWWPVGTELVGSMGLEVFTATVVENAQVKSGRSILLTSGPAAGKLCLTPTRAAIEATEAYRQAHNLGRGGGVTNGWQFWKAQQPA